MKRFIFVVAALAISSSAFAQGNGPVRQGNLCWAAMDQRGYGFWDSCADAREIALRNREDGRRDKHDEPRTFIRDMNTFGGGGGGGGGGGR